MMVDDDVCVQRWLNGLSLKSRDNRLALLRRYFLFVGVSPSACVEWQRENRGDYRFLDSAYEWLDGEDLAISTKNTRLGLVRGFFLVNRASLPQDRHRFSSNRERVVGELSVEAFRKILLGCNLTYRAAFLTMFQSGSGVGELLYINKTYSSYVWDEVRKGSRIIRFMMPGRKQNRNRRPYYTFIGGDAIDALRQLFHSEGWRKNTVLFQTEYGEAVSVASLQNYFRRHAIEAGVIKRKTPPCLECGGETVRKRHKHDGVIVAWYFCVDCQSGRPASEYNISFSDRGRIRYKVKTHELRDLFRTEWHRAQAFVGVDADVGEFMMGHSIDALGYDKIMRDVGYASEQFRRAMPFLNILSEEPRKVERDDVEEELMVLRKEIGKYRQAYEFLGNPKVQDALLRLAEEKK